METYALEKWDMQQIQTTNKTTKELNDGNCTSSQQSRVGASKGVFLMSHPQAGIASTSTRKVFVYWSQK
jgi:hypothetical protein